MMSTRLSFLRLSVVCVLAIVVAASAYAGCFPLATVTGVSPNTGPPAGGTAVTITATNFTSPATATFGGVAATNVIVVNSTTITARTPAHAVGPVDVVVTTFGTCSSAPLPNGFTYQVGAIPTISPIALAALAGILALVGALVIKR
jgi:hypothetical protein